MHPLTGSLTEMSDEDLQKKYNELMGKVNSAHRLGNAGLISQLYMILEDYRNEITGRTDKQMAALQEKSKGFKTIIDIQ